MMRWYNKMYLGESIQGKKMYYQYAIQHTKRLTGTYCLMPAACKDDLIDICGSDLLRGDSLTDTDVHDTLAFK